MKWLWTVAAAITIAWTALPLLRHEAWWIRVFDFPRVQIAVATALVLAASAWLASAAGGPGALQTVLSAALAACLVYQLAVICVYTPLRTAEVADAPRADGTPAEATTRGRARTGRAPEDGLRSGGAPTGGAHFDPRDGISVLVANVLTPNRGADALLSIVAETNADLLLFVETDDWWQSRLDVLEKDYPHTVKHPSDNLYGMHLYSRLELSNPEIRFLVEQDVPSIHARLVLRSGHGVALHCVHPRPPAPGENLRSTERDAELLVVAKAVAAHGGSTIVLGDLNDVAWSATTTLFKKISGLADPRVGRGMYSTFHARYPVLRWPLDHIFVSHDFALRSLRRLGPFGSDHFPICASLLRRPALEAAAISPAADTADLQRARETIDEAGSRPA